MSQQFRGDAEAGTLTKQIRASINVASDAHWCNFGLASAYVDQLAAHGLVVGAHADDAGVEAIELAGHPFFMATLFQPQMGALAGRDRHPVLQAFIDAL